MENKRYKEFPISSWAIDNKAVIYALTFIIFILGLLAYYDMPRENFPEIKETKIYISTLHPGNTAEDVEKLITKPLEDAFSNVSNVTKITSSSQEDYSMITVEFNEDITVFEAKVKIKDRVDQEIAKEGWPTSNNGKVEPNVFDINISEEFPILNINLQGDFLPVTLKEYAERLKDIIEAYPEIKEVSIRGVQDKEVEIAVDIYKMTASKVSFDDIINSIRGGNTTISAGNIITSGERKTIRLIGEIETPEQLENFVVKSEKKSIYLRDIAKVHFKEKERTTYARSFGENVVMLDVKKLSGQNQIEAAKKIRQLLEDSKETFIPPNLNVFITNDQSETVENTVDEMVNNIIFGIILVVFVLMFFLNFRNSLFVGIAIPMSMFLSYLILNYLGYTLNTMVLFALVMGLGMLVDNGIVVVENVYRLVDKEGMSPINAAKVGLGEIALPIIVSTATTVGAFIPLGFWPGTMGEFMVYFPITLSVVLGSSLFVALLINSVLVSRYIKTEEGKIHLGKLKKYSLIFLILGLVFIIPEATRALGTLFIMGVIFAWFYRKFLTKGIYYFQTVVLVKLENFYRKAIKFSLSNKNPRKFLLGTFGLLFLSFIALGIRSPKVLFFPENDPNQVFVYLEYPQGTDIEKTNTITKEIEQEVYRIVSEDQFIYNGENFMISSAIAQVGEGSGNPFVDGGSGGQQMPHKGKVTLLFKNFKERRGQSSEDMRQYIQEKLLGKYPGLKVSVEKDAVGPPVGFPVNIDISGEGYEYSELVNAGKKMERYINSLNIAGIEGLKINVSKQKPLLEVRVNREKAGDLGISASQVGSQIRRALFGEKAGVYKYQGDDYDINIRFNQEDRYNLNALFNQNITFRDPATGKIKEVPISTLVETKRNTSFDAIKHINSARVVTLYSSILPGYNATEIVGKIKKQLADFRLQDGMAYKFTGEIEEQGKQMTFLLKALFMGLSIIILLLVLQFNSFSKPAIIFLAIFLSFIGVLFGLVIFNMDFIIIMTMLGIISLAGIVVNNGVVLLDYTQILIDRKREELELKDNESISNSDIRIAIIEGGSARLRPVLITAITTVFGLIPLAIGLNIDFFSLLSEWDPKIYVGGDNVVFWGPLAWTVIFGLIFATFLTLIIVPISLYIALKIKKRFNLVV